jgi:hypothetical protein
MPAGMTDRSVEPVGQNFSDGVWPVVFDVCTLIRVERYNRSDRSRDWSPSGDATWNLAVANTSGQGTRRREMPRI